MPTLKSTYKVLHLTDIHYEINYAVGSLAFDCGVTSVKFSKNLRLFSVAGLKTGSLMRRIYKQSSI